jgi:hypothetical protein
MAKKRSLSAKKAWKTMKSSSPAKKANYTKKRKIGALRAVVSRQKKKIKSPQGQQ